MKLKRGMLIMALTLGPVMMATADNEWGFFGSYWAPADGDDGLGGGIKVGVEMVDRVQLDVRYSIISGLIDEPDAELDVQPLEFGFSYAIPAAEGIEPYIGIGGGYYFMDADRSDPLDDDIDDEFGFYMSTGLEWTLSRSGAQYGETTTKLVIEAIYRMVEANDMKVSGTPGRLEDADLSGLGVQAGFLIGW